MSAPRPSVAKRTLLPIKLRAVTLTSPDRMKKQSSPTAPSLRIVVLSA
nr:hypothetical protein [Paenibacillus phytorum]